jgi:long-chain acyl-CoA synthetase
MASLIDHLNFGNIYFKDKTYSPETILANIDAVAENITKRSISNSPFVYLFAPNHIKTVFGLFGIIKAGRVCVLVDPALKHFELEEMMKDAAPGALIRPDKETDTFDFFKEFEFKHYQLSPSRIRGLEDVAIMLYTAADDGFAKGAMLTHANILANARAIREINNVKEGTVSCALIAFHHLFALQTGIIAPSIAGANLIIEDITDFRSLKNVGIQIEKNRATHLYAVPAVYLFLKKIPQTRQIANMATSFVSGGVKLTRSIFDSYKNDLHCEIHEGYGLTEASPICTWHGPNDKIKLETVGRSFPCCEIEIHDENNKTVENGQSGEICIKGSNVMKGYFGNESATKGTIVDGWLRSGDLGKMDDQGYVYLTGLKKRMLNVGGNKVYPSELERLMRKNINVRSVEVFGEADEILGDTVQARVQLRESSKEIQNTFQKWCLENITGYKVPKVPEFI